MNSPEMVVDDVCHDRLLRFNPATNTRYEAEHGKERAVDLRRNILIGLAFYNVYNLTSIVLMPDIFWLTVFARTGVVTAGSIGLWWMLPKFSPALREIAVAFGLINAMIFPIGFFWLTSAPLGNYTFGELSLTVFYGNMLLVLRFVPALFFNVVTAGFVALAVLTKPGLTGDMMFAFLVQFITATSFAALGNYLTERRRCKDYVRTLQATLRAETAEISSIALQEISQTDALTGLPNRRYLDERLADWFKSETSLAVIMIDVDHFKPYNDRLGHPAGDDCLQRLALAFMNATQDPNCFCARFGGEEFTVVMRNSAQLDAARLAQTLLRSVTDLQLAHPSRADGTGIVTISLGVAHLSERRGASVETLLSSADEALYAAKRRGRNRFVLADDVQDHAQDVG